MVINIKKGDSQKEIKELLDKLAKKKKGSGLASFYGKMKGKFGHGLSWQKTERIEWD